MYDVMFDSVLVFQSKSDIDAVSFALALHQQSNVAHRIKVFGPDNDDPICQLSSSKLD